MKNGLISSTINLKMKKKNVHFSARAWNTTKYMDLAFGVHGLEMKRMNPAKKNCRLKLVVYFFCDVW